MGALVGMEIGLVGQLGLWAILAKENWNTQKKSRFFRKMNFDSKQEKS